MDKPENLKLNQIVFPKIGKIYYSSQKRELIFIYKEIFENREYIQHGIELKPGNIVFDIGAHNGLFTLFVNKECDNDVTIFAFEPLKSNYQILEKNLSLYGLNKRNNIKLFNLGLTHTEGPKEATFSYSKRWTGTATMKSDFLQEKIMLAKRNPDLIMKLVKQKHPIMYILSLPLSPIRSWIISKFADFHISRMFQVQCKLTTLSNICREYSIPRIDLLKIDVEGAELDVLRGIEEEDWPRIKQIVMEIHYVENLRDEIKKLLHSKGFNRIEVVEAEWSKISMSEYIFYMYARR
ncbi:MAG TPA: FkbM family methyltransferase [Thermodesulfobacteriota bacterium]